MYVHYKSDKLFIKNKFIKFSKSTTFRDLKKSLEKITKVCADDQVIKHFSEILGDDEKLFDVMSKTNRNALLVFEKNRESLRLMIWYQDDEKANRPRFVSSSDDESDIGSSSSSSKSDSTSNENAKINGKRNLNEDLNLVQAKSRPLTWHVPQTFAPNTAAAGPHIVPIVENEISNCGNEISQITSNRSKSTSTLLLPREMSALIPPEMRKYITIVATANCEEFLESCFVELLGNASTDNLKFNSKMPIFLDTVGFLWIACNDDFTLEWLYKNITSFTNGSCNIQKLTENLEYRAYSVVLPSFPFQGRQKSLSEQFQLLEHQNKGLNTEKWIVERQHVIEDKNDEFFEQKVSDLCRNEVIFLQIDLESEKFMKNKNFCIKYGFWDVVFQLKKKV